MNKIIAGIPVTGLIIPGEVYILTDADDDIGIDNFSGLYMIREEREILLGLDMYYCTVLDDVLEKYLSGEWIFEDCYEIRFQCWNKEDKMFSECWMFLRRLRRFEEEVKRMKEVWRWEGDQG